MKRGTIVQAQVLGIVRETIVAPDPENHDVPCEFCVVEIWLNGCRWQLMVRSHELGVVADVEQETGVTP